MPLTIIVVPYRRDVMTMMEMETNYTMQETTSTMNDMNECVPTRTCGSHAPNRMRSHDAKPVVPEQSKDPCDAHRWQQMMRARVGIDTSKSWADWAEEEEEAATPIVTFASKVKLKLGSSPEKMLYKSVAPEPLHFAADMSGEQPSPPSTSITNTETFDGSVRSHPTGPHPHAPQD